MSCNLNTPYVATALGSLMHFILCISKMVIRSLSIFPSFHPLHPMASNPAHVQGMISPQEGRGGARWSCNRAGGGFSYSTDAAGSWSKMALGGPLNLIEISYQWKKWNTINEISRDAPLWTKTWSSHVLFLITNIRCWMFWWKLSKATSAEKIHLRRDFWNQSD